MAKQSKETAAAPKKNQRQEAVRQIDDAAAVVMEWASARVRLGLVEEMPPETCAPFKEAQDKAWIEAQNLLSKQLLPYDDLPVGADVKLLRHWETAYSSLASGREANTIMALLHARAVLDCLDPRGDFHIYIEEPKESGAE